MEQHPFQINMDSYLKWTTKMPPIAQIQMSSMPPAISVHTWTMDLEITQSTWEQLISSMAQILSLIHLPASVFIAVHPHVLLTMKLPFVLIHLIHPMFTIVIGLEQTETLSICSSTNLETASTWANNITHMASTGSKMPVCNSLSMVRWLQLPM